MRPKETLLVSSLSQQNSCSCESDQWGPAGRAMPTSSDNVRQYEKPSVLE